MKNLLFVGVCILQFVTPRGHVFGDDFLPETISELKDYFEKEIRRVEKRYDAEILELRQTLKHEREENSREIAVLRNKYGNALQEIRDLKHRLVENGVLTDETTFGGNRGTLFGHSGTNVSEEKPQISTHGSYIKDEEPVTDKGEAELNVSVKNRGMDRKRQVNIASGSRVAFFATLSKNFLQASPNQTIIFDKVVTNVGSGYHSSHGIFTAMVPGIYVFSATVMSEGNYIHAGMVKNSQILVRLNGGHWDMSSHMTVVEMKSGDIVSVRSHERGIDFSGDDNSSFSGFLLYDYSDENPVVGK